MLRVLFLGDVVGRPGRSAVGRFLRSTEHGRSADLVIANAENASGGRGLEPGTAEEMRDLGIDVLTTGNHVWQSRAIGPYLAETTRVLRPYNYAPECPGVGITVVETRRGGRAAVLNLIGRVFMGPAECPFRAADRALAGLPEDVKVVVVDMHGEATSEKGAMGRYLDGRVSAVIGTHTHVQTADEGLLPGGTAFLTDAGMCGPADSILGVRPERVIERFLRQMPNRFDLATGPVLVQGVAMDVDPATGQASAIRRIQDRIAH